ncbi:MAG: ABC transporter ATP-binding protein [Candidatus Cloacimonadota bacterium]|nr:MAG: ABC transporter ATP-binding protein [Candidatus Cloacimonadota bacterium]
MHHGGYYHEEEELSKPYDVRLMKRLLVFVMPYKGLVIICIFLLFFITGFNLSLPYITKIAIDRYITPPGRFMDVKDEDVLDRLKSMDAIFPLKDGYILDLRRVDKDTRYELEKQHLFQEKYFIFDSKIIDKSILESLNKKNILIQYNTLYFLDAKKAGKLSLQEMLTLRKKDIVGINYLAIIFGIILILTFIFNYVQVYILQYTGQKVMFDMRMKIFSHLQQLNVSFFDKNPVGRLVTRVTNDVAVINEMFTNVIVFLFSDIFILTGVVIIMFYLNWQLASATMLVTPIIIVVTIIFRNRVRKAFRWVRLTVAKINVYLQENISGMRVVQLFTREKENMRRFRKINRENFDANMSQLIVFAIFRPLIEIIGALAVALIVWYGGGRVIEQTLTLGAFVAFLSYVERFFQPIRDLSEKYNILQAAMAASERVFLLLDKKDELEDTSGKRELKEVKGSINFDRVWFAYSDDNYVLKNITFSVEPGESMAIVGATGAGKTSLINLLLRFYEVEKGKISLDNVDIRDLDRDFLRKNIGVVLQDVFLFSGSIKRNIALSKEDMNEGELEMIARYVNADRFINKIPDGFDAEVKERGVSLSQGEKQLLAFARALAYNPSVLILDEATSSVDTETESLIQDALAKLMKGRTFIVIAHRLSTIERIKNIIVLQKGRIVERGTHKELLEKRGYYYDLYRVQFKNTDTQRK